MWISDPTSMLLGKNPDSMHVSESFAIRHLSVAFFYSLFPILGRLLEKDVKLIVKSLFLFKMFSHLKIKRKTLL